MTKIRTLVAEDSLTVRKYLIDILSTDPTFEVVGEARDGQEAVALCEQHRPDVISMDMMMPVMSGLAATEHIMAHFPTPILIVSSATNRGEQVQGYEAIAAGAVDMLEKPDGSHRDESWAQQFLAALKLVSRIRVITHPRGKIETMGPARTPSPAPPVPASEAHGPYRVIALGASTGGPGAIVEVLRGLPPSLNLPILFVLHISEPFGASFAQWLNEQISRPASYACDGDPVLGAAGRVLMAPPGRHLVVQGGRLRITDGHSCRPSVDLLFESVALEYGHGAIAALLTGMGRDGASGLLDIRRAGGATFAQDEATSIVYGMPREAQRIGAAEHILPLRDIGPALGRLAMNDRGKAG
jgi:two-component system chemotaxis response regulator CheB